MENILSALYFVAMIGWTVFLFSVIFGIAPKLFTSIMREYIGRKKPYAYLLYASYTGTVLSIMSVIAMNALMTILVFAAQDKVEPNPLTLIALVIGIVQVLGVWGPTVKAAFIYHLLKDREVRDKEEDE